jgi:uncharacterized membrane protein YfhO
MVLALEAVGYQQVAEVELRHLGPFQDIFHIPEVALTLLKNPVPTTVIDPPVAWQRQGNTLSWVAAAQQSYTLRYRYHPDFSATQAGQPLAIEQVQPLPDAAVTFMQVTPPRDGLVALTFQPRWL